MFQVGLYFFNSKPENTWMWVHNSEGRGGCAGEEQPTSPWSHFPPLEHPFQTEG